MIPTIASCPILLRPGGTLNLLDAPPHPTGPAATGALPRDAAARRLATVDAGPDGAPLSPPAAPFFLAFTGGRQDAPVNVLLCMRKAWARSGSSYGYRRGMTDSGLGSTAPPSLWLEMSDLCRPAERARGLSRARRLWRREKAGRA